MRIVAIMLFAGAISLLGSPAQLTVAQLKQTIASLQSRGAHDNEIARAVANFRLTERLTHAELASLTSRNLGPDTKNALDILADESAWLDTPRSQWLNNPVPGLTEQNAIVRRTSDYAFSYIRSLPNFLCTEITRRFDDDATHEHTKGEHWGHLRLYDEITSALTFNKGQESNVIQSVNGKPYDRDQQMEGITVRGEFGGAIVALFLENSNAKVRWSHWEAAG